MSKTSKQGLSRYVERVMNEKHLSRRDVKLRSGGEITDSYVSSNDVAEIAQEVIKLSPAARAVVLQYVKRVGRADRRAQRKRRSV